jgi:16S rRNA G527 N7-methylase RsmG
MSHIFTRYTYFFQFDLFDSSYFYDVIVSKITCRIVLRIDNFANWCHYFYVNRGPHFLMYFHSMKSELVETWEHILKTNEL